MKQLALFIFLIIGFAAMSAAQSTADTTPEFHHVVTRVEASFIGGENSWRSFIEQNIDASVPGKNKAPKGTYIVQVQFYIDTTGKLGGLKALTHYGYGMEAEVIRLLRKSPRWSPAKEDERPVKVYRKQPITFKVL
jgi:protein TonB